MSKTKPQKKSTVRMGDDYDHKAMMENPDRWPQWPFLPVKRPTDKGWPECGLMVSYEPERWTVFEANLFRLPDLKTVKALVENWNASSVIKCHKYENVDELLDAGWMVD